MRYDIYVDSYKRYKRGTTKAAQWLANAGRLCGVKNLGTKHGSGSKYLMPLNKFRELAQTIASCKEPEIEVRPELLDLLREVITLRQAATVFYRNNSSSNQLFQQNDQGHYYVIQVLQDVLAILEPLTKTERVNRPSAATTNADEPTQISNIFDALEIEDLEDLPEPVVHLEITKGSNARRSK